MLPHACGDGHHVLTLCLCKPDNFVDLRLKAVGSVQIGDGGRVMRDEVVMARQAWAALADSSATLALTLAARAVAPTRLVDLNWHDPLAQRIAQACPLPLNELTQDDSLVRGIVLRSVLFDQCVLAAGLRAGSCVVTLGAGLCTRRSRLRARLDEKVRWVNVDLPPVAAVRELTISVEEGGDVWAGSVLDAQAWLTAVNLVEGAPHLLLLEGVLPYLSADEIRGLLDAIGAYFTRQHLFAWVVADFLHPAMAAPSAQGGLHLPVLSGFADAQALIAGRAEWSIQSQRHPFAEFSAGHAKFAADFVLNHGLPPYTVACLTVGELVESI